MIFILFFLSGAVGLVYQVLWLRELILVFGSTLEATSTVLAVFMGGLALGAYGGGLVADGPRRPSPLRIYAWLEAGVGIAALGVPALLPLTSWPYGEAFGADPWVRAAARLLCISLVLLPPTVLMGATLPALSRYVASDERRIGGQVGALYAINTFGAVLGTAFAGFVALPSFGMRATNLGAVATNLGLAVVAWGWSRREPRAAPPPPSSGPTTSRRNASLVLVVFAASGSAAMVLEVTWTRALALVFGSSVYAFSLMLIAFLVGLAGGGAAVAAWLRRRPELDASRLLAGLLGSAGVLSLLTAWTLQALPGVISGLFLGGGPSTTRWFLAQLGVALAVMFPATFALGGVFPTVLQLYAGDLRHVAGSVGRVYAANTAGTIAGALLAGFVLVPFFGVANVLAGTAALQILLAAVALATGIPTARRLAAVAAAGVVAAGCVLVRPGWDFLLMNTGVYFNLGDAKPGTTWTDWIAHLRTTTRVVLGVEGRTASVLVADHLPSGSRYLAVNGKIEASSKADLETQLLASHLPLLFHDDPKDVLVIGLASGISVSGAAAHPVGRIRVVEVEPRMLDAAALFAESNRNVLDDPRVRVVVNDARNQLRMDPATYDVIVSEPSNPWMTVASNLFTEDFFSLARDRLRPGGIFCQWIQLYCLRPEDVKSIAAAFRESFPHVTVFSTMGGVDLLMLGTDRPVRFDLPVLERRMSELRVRMSLARADVRSPRDLLALFRVGDRELDRWIAGVRPNTDDNGRVEFNAPKALHLDTLEVNAEALRAAGTDPTTYVMPELSPLDRAALRLSLAEKLVDRGEPKWARQTLQEALRGPLAAEALEIDRRAAVAAN